MDLWPIAMGCKVANALLWVHAKWNPIVGLIVFVQVSSKRRPIQIATHTQQIDQKWLFSEHVFKDAPSLLIIKTRC